MGRREYNSTRRTELIRLGMCVLCRKSKSREGLTACEDCRQKRFQQKRNWEANGLCVRCGRATQPGRKKCSACLNYYRERYHAACQRIGKTSSRRVQS